MQIDDFFGPLNLETVAQTLHFALNHRVSDAAGRACYLTRESRDRRWTFDTFTIHGVDNGLMDVATRNWIDNYFNRDAWLGVPLHRKFVQQREFKGAGHQDSLIGETRTTGPIFSSIRSFLRQAHMPRKAPRRFRWHPRAPWAGPVWAPPLPAVQPFALSGDPGLGVPDFALCMPVRLDPIRDRYEPVPIRGRINPLSMATVFLAAVNADRNGWHRIDLPKYFLDPNVVDGVLIIHCYDHTATGVRNEPCPAPLLTEPDSAWSPLGNVNRRQIGRVIGRRVVETSLNQGDPNTWPELIALLQELNQPRDLETRVRRLRGRGHAPDWRTRFIPALAKDKRRRASSPPSCQYSQGILDECIAWTSYERLAASSSSTARTTSWTRRRTCFSSSETRSMPTPRRASSIPRRATTCTASLTMTFSATSTSSVRCAPSPRPGCSTTTRSATTGSRRRPGGSRVRKREARDHGVAAYRAFQRRAHPGRSRPPPATTSCGSSSVVPDSGLRRRHSQRPAAKAPRPLRIVEHHGREAGSAC